MPDQTGAARAQPYTHHSGLGAHSVWLAEARRLNIVEEKIRREASVMRLLWIISFCGAKRGESRNQFSDFEIDEQVFMVPIRFPSKELSRSGLRSKLFETW